MKENLLHLFAFSSSSSVSFLCVCAVRYSSRFPSHSRRTDDAFPLQLLRSVAINAPGNALHRPNPVGWGLLRATLNRTNGMNEEVLVGTHQILLPWKGVVYDENDVYWVTISLSHYNVAIELSIVI